MYAWRANRIGLRSSLECTRNLERCAAATIPRILSDESATDLLGGCKRKLLHEDLTGVQDRGFCDTYGRLLGRLGSRWITTDADALRDLLWRTRWLAGGSTGLGLIESAHVADEPLGQLSGSSGGELCSCHSDGGIAHLLL